MDPTAPVDPADQTANYNTPLKPEQEKAFQAWAKANPRLGNTYDYDARGFWLHGAQAGANGHGADAWKKPNHPTFSDQSNYHSPYTPGGSWKQIEPPSDQYGSGRWSFTPSPQNFKYQSPQDLQAYWNKVEKPNGHVLDVPETYQDPQGAN